MRTRLSFVVALTAVAALACSEPTDPVAHGKDLYASCRPCHGPEGGGTPAVKAPEIGGLPAWYIEAQLMKFRAGKRGYHFDDLEGLRMRPMSLSLPTAKDVKDVAAYIAQLPRPQHAVTVQGGNVDHGKQLFNTCIACHGADAMGNQALNAPMLAGADDWYLVEQVMKFKKKIRGDPKVDPVGATMQAMSNTLPDEQSIKDVVAYIKTLPPPPPAPAPKG